MPRKTFVSGEILTAADVNTNLMDQAVMTFADASARDSAIPSPSAGMVSYLADSESLQLYTTAWEDVKTGFTAGTAITASDASWAVPTLASPVAKVTVIGGGGGGGADFTTNGGAGGSTIFNAAGAGTVTATGGGGGRGGTSMTGHAGLVGFRSHNGGAPGRRIQSGFHTGIGEYGQPGEVVVAFLNLTGVTTVNVTIGAGGSAGGNGGAGGRGEVIVEYVAG